MGNFCSGIAPKTRINFAAPLSRHRGRQVGGPRAWMVAAATARYVGTWPIIIWGPGRLAADPTSEQLHDFQKTTI